MDPNLNPIEDGYQEDCNQDQEDIPALEADDLYAILTLTKEATQDDIIQKYRKLSRTYHPDKHSSEQKDKAQTHFSRLKEAYEILSDPNRRAIYDQVGEERLKQEEESGHGGEIVRRYQNPEEIREEFERRNREREERELERKTNPRGQITVRLNATEMFNPYVRSDGDFNEDYYSERGPLVEFAGFHFTQSVETPLTLRDTFVLSGAVNAQNGRGKGNITCGLRKTLSNKAWGELEMGGSTTGLDFGLKGSSQLGDRFNLNFSGACSTGENEVKPALAISLTSQLDPKSSGSLTWRVGAMSGIHSIFVKEIGDKRFTFGLHLGFPHSFASFQIIHSKDDNRFRVGARGGTFGALLEYGVERKLSPVSQVGATVSIGVPLGVTVRFKIVKASQTYLFPIQLADEIIPSAVFYGTLAPFLVWMLTKKLLLEPIEKEKMQREKEKKKMTNRSRMQAKRIEAENAIQLMMESYKRIKIEEEKVDGLIIVLALYGRLITSASDQNELECIDVTIPVQCLVMHSKLVMPGEGRNSLPGFYDPAVGEDKNLMVRYKFRGELHEIVVREKEMLKIPKQAHRVDPL